ncbi:MAG: Triosephosphate isomerase [candidate division TM6 bacterium GW2011_GWF2_32_72]|nr:MAG: Triosephosphate isomerase [candidate division TM6 bacterium GW2011_GWF2_32_72]
MKNIFICNWKMQLTLKEELNFFKTNKKELEELSQKNKSKIILCPSFLSIPEISKNIGSLNLGAQDCSDQISGAVTGQISAKSLQEVGCSYCIVGHSERRKFNCETSITTGKKANLLLEQNLTPIICIGENEKEYKQGETKNILAKQIDEVFQQIKIEEIKKDQMLLIAYEPIWAIGTGLTPTSKELEEIFSWLEAFLKQKGVFYFKILYGGSVSNKTIQSLNSIKNIDGFLIGGSSLDFQELKKIVDSCYCVKF